MKKSLLLAAFLLGVATPALAQIVVIVTPAGTVQGTTVVTPAGTVEKFQGIPYAEPPVRWQAPVAKPPSVTTIDATLPKAACSQLLGATALDCRDNGGQANGTLVGSEDCLTLSVWRPAAAAATPRPVMVWIHGGALVTGCAKDGLSEASDLALQGTQAIPAGDGRIVVSLQYRLGPMGFFALPELQSEDANLSVGNYGLLDQVLALQWVQTNISAFGGDPSNVTIFGESAGGFSTYVLEASPVTAGLFNRAVSESGAYGQAIALEPGVGAPTGTFGPTATAFPRGIALSESASLGCTDPLTRAACMRGKTTSEIFTAWNTGGGGLIGGGGASPAIDGYLITEQASQMILESPAVPRPLVTGANANEMTLFTLGTSIPTFTDYENLIRAQFGTTAGNIILGVYPSAAFATPIAAYRRVTEDILFVCPTFTQGKLIHDKGGEAHVYHFANPVSPALGAFHAAELFYVFGNLARLSSVFVAPDAGDTLLSDAMQNAWTSYAASGAPTATPAWDAFDPGPGGPASAGGVLTWNLTPGNALANTFVTSGSLRDGRCAQLAALTGTLNGDFDSFTNDRDNCPFATNTDQADAGAVASDPSDGIGDRCQCGDTSDDGVVEDGDVTALRDALAGSATLTSRGAAKCQVESASPDCDIVDVAVLRRRLADPQQAPGISQVCPAANPA